MKKIGRRRTVKKFASRVVTRIRGVMDVMHLLLQMARNARSADEKTDL